MVVAEARQVANDAFSRVLRLVDSVIAPETRQQFYNNISAFAGEHPLLASFIAFQILLSFTPLAIFAAFVIGTLLVSAIGAVAWALFWIGIAFLILVPVLFITVPIGFFLWLSATATFLVARWIYNALPFSVEQHPNKNGIAIVKDEKSTFARDNSKPAYVEKPTFLRNEKPAFEKPTAYEKHTIVKDERPPVVNVNGNGLGYREGRAV